MSFAEAPQFPGKVSVRFDDWANWNPDGWEQSVPEMALMNWIHLHVCGRTRPFIIIDSNGVNHKILMIVNARIGQRANGDRLYVVYLHGDKGTIECAWGELLFIDGGDRIPGKERKSLRLWLISRFGRVRGFMSGRMRK
jgi:hypothetical protein